MPVLTRLHGRECPGPDQGQEDGAVLVVVGVSLLVLLLIAAFVVDLGLAYTERRQVQTAVDAAAVASVKTYLGQPGTCIDMRDVSRVPAIDEGVRFIADNLGLDDTSVDVVDDVDTAEIPEGGVLAEISLDCDAAMETFEVAWEIRAATPAGLGAAAGIDEIVHGATATAQVRVVATIRPDPPSGPDTRTDLLPYVLCSAHVPAPTGPDWGTVEKINLPLAGSPGPGTGIPASEACPTEDGPGRFWTVVCPDQSFSFPSLAQWTEHGCPSTVAVAEGSPPACSVTPSEHCLSAVSGFLDDADVSAAWSTILGKQVFFPAFCGRPDCDPPAVVDPHPDGPTYYPASSIAGVTVCGYDWGDGHNGQVTTGACSDNPDGFVVDDGAGDQPSGPPETMENYLLVAFTHLDVAGEGEARDCAIGDPCDTGPRQVFLTE